MRMGDNWREDDGSYENKVFCICDKCKSAIEYGADMLDDDGTYYCEKCFNKMRKVAGE